MESISGVLLILRTSSLTERRASLHRMQTLRAEAIGMREEYKSHSTILTVLSPRKFYRTWEVIGYRDIQVKMVFQFQIAKRKCH